MVTSKSGRKVALYFAAEGQLNQIRDRELSPDGKYVDVARPWRPDDLKVYRTAGRALYLMGRGVSDLDEVIRQVHPALRAAAKSKPSSEPVSAARGRPPRVRRRRSRR
jgi:hypothetical protein